MKRRYKGKARVLIIASILFLLGLVIGIFVGQAFAITEDVPIQKNETPVSVIEELEVETEVVQIDEPKVISLGTCKLTAYCCENYPHICNDGDGSKTSTGATPTVGRTVAVDPKVIPYGSEVIINGHTYIAEDCGGAIKGNKVDILFATHEEAMDFGVRYAEVSYIVKE